MYKIFLASLVVFIAICVNTMPKNVRAEPESPLATPAEQQKLDEFGGQGDYNVGLPMINAAPHFFEVNPTVRIVRDDRLICLFPVPGQNCEPMVYLDDVNRGNCPAVVAINGGFQGTMESWPWASVVQSTEIRTDWVQGQERYSFWFDYGNVPPSTFDSVRVVCVNR